MIIRDKKVLVVQNTSFVIENKYWQSPTIPLFEIGNTLAIEFKTAFLNILTVTIIII